MTSKLLGRLTLFLGALLLVTLFAWEAFSAELNVVQIYRATSLSDEAPSYRDFYINGTSTDGLKKNLVVNVYRKTDVKDSTGTQNLGELELPVGQLRILFVGPKVSIAREYKSIQFESSPLLEQSGIMIGDKIDTRGSFVDNKKISPHNISAGLNNPAPNRTTASSSEVKIEVKVEEQKSPESKPTEVKAVEEKLK